MTMHRIRPFTVALLLLGGLAVSIPAAAQQKIGVIDTRRIVIESNTGKTAMEQLNQIQQQKQQDLEAKQQEVEQLRNRLNEGRLSLAEDRLQEMQAELEAKVVELRRFQEDAAAELERRRGTALKAIEEKVMPVINQVGEEQGYAMIFNKFESGLVFADEAVDITSLVIQRLDGGTAGGQ